MDKTPEKKTIKQKQKKLPVEQGRLLEKVQVILEIVKFWKAIS